MSGINQRQRLPRAIWALGTVSLFMDVSSEIVHGLLPVFLVSVLGASVISLGVFEGLAEATALVVKVFSGPISDWWGRRKPLVIVGYSMGAISKPFFALASSASMVYAARLFDRIGKGIRGAPRDALVADIAPEELRGAAFGLRQSLDTVGAFLGPILAIALMHWTGGDYRTVFWLAAIPGALAVATLVFGVSEPESQERKPRTNPIRLAELKAFGPAFWFVVCAGALFQLARFSEAFLILRTKDQGLELAYAPLVLIVMNIVYALSAYPVGYLSDRMRREWFLLIGIAVLTVAELVLGWSDGLVASFVGIGLWGLHLGLTQGTLTALVADTCSADCRGSAYGFFSLLSAVALLAASSVAGVLWETIGPAATFYGGAAFSLLSGLVFWGSASLWSKPAR